MYVGYDFYLSISTIGEPQNSDFTYSTGSNWYLLCLFYCSFCKQTEKTLKVDRLLGLYEDNL